MIVNLSARRDQLADERTVLGKVKNLTIVGLPVLVPESHDITNNWRVFWPVNYHDPVTGDDFPQWVHQGPSGFLVRMDCLPEVEEMVPNNTPKETQ